MPSIIWMLVAFFSGVLLYLLPPVLGPLFPIEWREKIGLWYYKQSLRSFRQVAIVRELLSGYGLHVISVDKSLREASVTLSSQMLGDDRKLPFRDPDDRIKRLFSRPVAVVPDMVPAAVDAELSEWGHWVEQKHMGEGIQRGGKVDPYIEIPEKLHIADPYDVMPLLTNSVAPENIESAKSFTKQRFAKYGGSVGAVETLATFTGFAVGVGGVAVLQYLNQRVLDSGGGGGGPTAPTIPLGQLSAHAIDTLAVVL